MSEETQDDILEIGDHRFTSRLLLGTAAYPDRQTLLTVLSRAERNWSLSACDVLA